jgi:hypothetical protein
MRGLRVIYRHERRVNPALPECPVDSHDFNGVTPHDRFVAVEALPEWKATENQVREWFTHNPHLNLGIVCGQISEPVVLDQKLKRIPARSTGNGEQLIGPSGVVVIKPCQSDCLRYRVLIASPACRLRFDPENKYPKNTRPAKTCQGWEVM